MLTTVAIATDGWSERRYFSRNAVNLTDSAPFASGLKVTLPLKVKPLFRQRKSIKENNVTL